MLKFNDKIYSINLLDSNDNYLLNRYFSKYNLDLKLREEIKSTINVGLHVQKFLIDRKKNSLNLEEESLRIEDALSVIMNSDVFGYDEPYTNVYFYEIIHRKEALAYDLKQLSKEKTNVSNIYDAIAKYPNLNKKVILSHFNQQISLKAIPVEVIYFLKSWVTERICNNRYSSITKNTKELIENIFNVNISDRDLQIYKNSFQMVSIANNLDIEY